MANLVEIRTSDTEALVQLRGVAERLQPDATRRLMKHIADELEASAQRRFDMRVDPDGQPWKPWAASTAEARAKERRGTLLEYTGRMRDSMQRVFGDKESVLSILAPYAVYHDSIRQPRTRLPRRGLLTGAGGAIGLRDRELIDDLVEKYLNGQLR